MTPPLLRWLGAGLILCGGLLVRQELLSEERKLRGTRRELAGAFEAMAGEIRLMLTPIPALLRRSRGQSAEAFFRGVREELARGTALDDAWRRAAQSLPLPEEERETVASLGARLGGEAEETCAALALAASELRRAYVRTEEQRSGHERLITSICISVSLFFAILLL